MSNILLNRSFESGAIDNWTYLTGSVSKSSSFAYDGTYSCKFTNPTSAYSGRGIESDEVAATPGTEYTFGIWIYIEDTGSGIPSSSTTTHIRGRLKFYDSSHNFLSYGYYDTAPGHDDWGWVNIATWDAWLYKSFSFIAPANTAYISMLLESREDDNPSPPPVGQPSNNVYLDYGIIDEGALLYTEDDQRIVGAIGVHYDEDDQRIYGYIMGPMPSDDDYRIYGLIADHVMSTDYLIYGEIRRKVEWLDDPDAEFLSTESDKCNFPQKRVLFFHPALPDNDFVGPDGELKYVDLTDRVTQIGNISRDMASSPTDSPQLVVSDLTIQVDNSDYYFSDRNSNSPFYDILAASGNYVGWEDGGRVEVWCGFNYELNLTKLILKARMVIANIQTISNTGLATISLKDYSSKALDQLVGVPTASEGLERPLEYPTKIFTDNPAPDPNANTDWMDFNTERLAATIGMPPGAWVRVKMALPSPAADNPLGKHTRAILLQEAMNKPFDAVAYAATGITGLVIGTGVVGDGDETFTVAFDEETQKYKISTSGPAWIAMKTNGGAFCLLRWGFNGGNTYGMTTAVTELEGVAVTDSVLFLDLMRALIEDIGGWAAVDVSIESLPLLSFWNVKWDNTSLLTAIASVAQCGNGAMWMDDESHIFFRAFENMPTTEGPALSGSENYRQLLYTGQDAFKKIRKITVQGKFDTIVGEVDSGALIGTEYNISSSVLDGCTSGWAQVMAQAYYNRYNITPTSVVIKAEYLPSLELSNRVSITEPSSSTPIAGQVTSINLNPSGFTSDITIIPFTLSHTWTGKDDWDNFDAEDGGLYVPHDVQPLQTMLLGLTGYREYVFDSGAAAPRWLTSSYDATLDHNIFFIDHCDYTWIGRYTASTIMSATIPGGMAYNAADYVMILNGSGEDMSILCIVDGLNDVGPAHYEDYIIDTTFKMTGIYQYPPGTTESQAHYFAQTSRWIDNLNYLYAFVKCVGGTSSPRVGAWYGGKSYYLNNAAFINNDPTDGYNYSYLSLDQWYSQTLASAAATMHQQIPGYIDQGIFNIVPHRLQDPWTGTAKAGAGFARCKGEISQLELSSSLAADADFPVIEFASSITGLAGSWTAYNTDITAILQQQYLKMKVTLSRGTKYDTIPLLNSITVGYSI